jgi:hypothetical protein
MKLKPLIITTLCLAAAPLFGQEDSPVKATKSKLDKWVETQQLISEEKNDWVVEKGILEDTRKLLQDELDMLNSKIETLESDSTEADKERDALLLERVEYMRAQNSMEDAVRQLELKLMEILPQLPTPLQKNLENLIVRIPEDPKKSNISVSERVVNVMAILKQTERFNRDVHLFGETEKMGDGDPRQVWRVYWGLAGAYYVDDQGNLAGIGTIGEEGWTFTPDNSLSSRLALLRGIKEGTVEDISFIPLPARIQ